MKLGLDISPDYARAAYIDAYGQAHLIYLENGQMALPTMARQTMHGLLTGPEVAESLAGNSETTLCACTRLMGRAGSLPQTFLDQLPYDVRPLGDELTCNLLYDEVRPSQVYALLVKHLLTAAQSQCQAQVESVVLTVPASAEDRFRVQARQAVTDTGIEVSRLVNQPTAALLAATHGPQLGLAQGLPTTLRYVAVVNCTGDTTEISIARKTGDDIHILGTASDSTLGGDEMAWLVAKKLNERLKQQANLDIFTVDDSQIAAFGLHRAVIEVMQTLSLAPQTPLVLDHGGGFGRDVMTMVQQKEVGVWLQPITKKIQVLCRQALQQSRKRGKRLSANDIEAVVLTGTWATLPSLMAAIGEAFQRPAHQLYNQQAACLPVYGAALLAHNPGQILWDVTPYPLGINCYYGDEELFSPIIAANTAIPTPKIGQKKSYTQQYTTREVNQKSVSLDILQYRGPKQPETAGPNRVYPHECEVLGRWTFAGLKPKGNQRAPFSVTFALDTDGILHLQAEETATGHKLAVTVERKIGA